MSICEPVFFETLIIKIRTSEASKFVDNPQIFIQNLNDTMYDCLEDLNDIENGYIGS
jgi:hypothetical protein